jgi:hypothetical protein
MGGMATEAQRTTFKSIKNWIDKLPEKWLD